MPLRCLIDICVHTHIDIHLEPLYLLSLDQFNDSAASVSRTEILWCPQDSDIVVIQLSQMSAKPPSLSKTVLGQLFG